MNPSHRIFAAIVIVLVVIISSCSRTDELPLSSGDEESNTELALNEQYDNVRSGARLILVLRRAKQFLQRNGGKYHY